ncbi:Phosphoesterase domain [Macleaya cordata]|uniref:Phosphoesterase domain n=1 Tax=Macleaya cordata TaxID=56857 RepID=A0A200QK11_MACCD|nr:Phosphoesterase domain [Macleaya cordata]
MVVVGFLPSCLTIPRQIHCRKTRNYYISDRYLVPKRYSKRPIKGCIQRRQIVLPSSGDHGETSEGLRVFVLSDLHTDYSENMSWVKCLSTKRYKKDVLLVAGDVAETYNNFILTMSLLKDRFKHVFYVPGNHDLWCRWEGENCLDSLEKLNKLLDECRRLGVETGPMTVDGLGIIPLFSWYHESFDKEKDITGIRVLSLEMACKDFHACKWPVELSSKDLSLAVYFDAMNEKNQDKIEEIQRICSQIITFSHFLPRQELCPEKRMLFYPNLHKIIGSDSLEVRIRSIHGTDGSPSACHVFGHTHFCWDTVLQVSQLPVRKERSDEATYYACRYIQAPLAYPRERKRRMNGGEDWLPFCIYSSSEGGFTPRLSPCYWSDYYSINTREPENIELAPWVARFYTKQ